MEQERLQQEAELNQKVKEEEVRLRLSSFSKHTLILRADGMCYLEGSKATNPCLLNEVVFEARRSSRSSEIKQEMRFKNVKIKRLTLQ